jgi:hypothetical protein
MVKGPAADATGARQPQDLLCNNVNEDDKFFCFSV